MIYVCVPAFYFKLVWTAFSGTQWFVTVYYSTGRYKKKKRRRRKRIIRRYLYAFWMYKRNKVIKLCHYHYILCWNCSYPYVYNMKKHLYILKCFITRNSRYQLKNKNLSPCMLRWNAFTCRQPATMIYIIK